MRKLFSILLIGAFLTAVVATTGCGGGGGGGGIFGGLVAFVLIIAVTGGTGSGAAATFAASVRDMPRPAIVSEVTAGRQISISGDSLKIKVTPLSAGAAAGTPVIIENSALTATGGQLLAQTSIDYSVQDYLVELVSAGASDITLLKGIKRIESAPSSAVSTQVDPTETAKALTYEKWVAGSATDKSYYAFTYNLSKTTGAIASLTELASSVQNLIANNTGAFTTDILNTPSIQTQATTNAAGISTDVPPTSIPLPATKTVTDPVSEPSTQVKYAIAESTRTAVTGIPLHSRRAAAEAPAVPSAVPVLGGNTLLDPGALASIFMEALTGTQVTYGPDMEITEVGSTTATAYSIEAYAWNTAVHPPVRYLSSRRTISNIQVTAANGIVTKLVIGDGAQLDVEEFDASGKQTSHLALKIATGLSATVNFAFEAKTGSYQYNPTQPLWEFRYDKIATETTTVTVANQVRVEVQQDAYTAGVLSSTQKGQISISGISGTMTAVKPFMWGYYYYNGSIATWYPVYSKVAFKSLISETVSNLNIASTVTLGANGNSTLGINLDNLTVTLNNVSQTGTHPDFVVKSSGSTVNAAVSYTGAEPEKYGYIKSLAIAISNITFDSTATPKVSDGAVITVTKVNTDDTTDTITYKTASDKIVLVSGGSRYGGGSETITTLDNGDLKVEGSLAIANSDGRQVSLTYTATRANATGNVTVSVNLAGTIVTGTITFTLTPNSATTLITDGTYQTSAVSGTFSVQRNGYGTLTIGGTSVQFNLSGTGSPLASLLTF